MNRLREVSEKPQKPFIAHYRLNMAGYQPAADNTPAQFGEFVKKELDKYTKLVKEARIQVR